MPEPKPDSLKPRRRRFTLSLRVLMLTILVVGGLMGWKARKASLQRSAVAAIERAGGTITYDFQSPTGEYPPPSPTAEPAAPQWLRRMLGDEYFQEITGVIQESRRTPYELAPIPAVAERARVESLMVALATLDRLQSLTLRGTPLSTVALADLGRLTGLKTLILDDAINADAELASLRGLVQLESLTIQLDAGMGAPILRDGLANLVSLTRLRELHLGGDSVFAPSLDFTDGMADLESLMVEKSPFKDDFLAKLASRTKLRELSLPGTIVTDAGLVEIAKLTNLEHLQINGVRLTDAGFAHLAGLKNLKNLSLGRRSPNITDAGIAHLAGLTRLEQLQLWGGRVTDAGMAHLAGLTAMTDLRLASNPITDAGLVHLSRMTKLTDLDLSGTKITGLGLIHLPSPTTLDYLMLANSPITDDGLAGLSGMTGLSILYLGRTAITDAGLPRLTRLKSMQVFNLDQTAVTPQGLAALRPGWNPPVKARHWNKN